MLDLNIIPVEAPEDFDGLITLIDLRPYGLDNLACRDVPLALASLEGDTLHLKALLMRQEIHVCQFYSPPALPSCDKDLIPEVLARAFRQWHLTTNNFECCFFEAPPGAAFVRCFETDLPVHYAAEVVVEHLDTLQWPRFYLHLGSELSSIRSRRSVYRCALSNDFLTVERGCRRKKDDINSLGLRIEVFSHIGNDWVRSDIIESLSDDVEKELSQLPNEGNRYNLFKYSHDMYVRGSRVGVESAMSGGIYELEFCVFQLECPLRSHGHDELAARNVIIRHVGGRRLFDIANIRSDMNSLSRLLIKTLDVDSSPLSAGLSDWKWSHLDIL
ncbi:hypothetical protein [Pseudomonas caricapapayae]|nr:hypothetical protein [Pseudomonas caricapapayae]